MSLHLDASPAIVKLDLKGWGPTLREYIAAKAAKKEADAASRAADATIKSTREKLKNALGSAMTALCGKAVIVRKDTADVAAKLTLRDGSTIAWDKVTYLMVGNQRVDADDVLTLYGGRTGSIDFQINGAP